MTAGGLTALQGGGDHMTEKYKILWEGGRGELVEKKSRFIAQTRPAESEDRKSVV